MCICERGMGEHVCVQKIISNRVDQLQKEISPLIPIRFAPGSKIHIQQQRERENDEGYAFQLYNYSAIEIILLHLSFFLPGKPIAIALGER